MEEIIVALLAPVADGRCHWVRAPQGEPLPHLILTRVGGVRDYRSAGASGFVPSRVQVDAYADSYTTAKALARSVTATVSGYRSGAILGVFVAAERDLPATDAGEVSHLFRVSLDLSIVHME